MLEVFKLTAWILNKLTQKTKHSVGYKNSNKIQTSLHQNTDRIIKFLSQLDILWFFKNLIQCMKYCIMGYHPVAVACFKDKVQSTIENYQFIKELYVGASSSVRSKGLNSEKFVWYLCECQGCVLSPWNHPYDQFSGLNWTENELKDFKLFLRFRYRNQTLQINIVYINTILKFLQKIFEKILNFYPSMYFENYWIYLNNFL